MDKLEFQNDLTSSPIPFVVSKWVLERVPFIFGTDNVGHIEWKEALAKKLGVDSRAMIITGSAGCGFSLSPVKEYKSFNSTSDIDVALISHFHFDLAWHELRNLGTRRYDLTPVEQSHVQEHVERLIYWGTIATDKILALLPFGGTWIPALSDASSSSPADGREVKVRIYRDFESLRQYQMHGFRKLRSKAIAA
jgi:hypothetical protein